MSSALFDLGRFCYRRGRLVLLMWLLALAVIGGTAGLLGKGTTEIYEIPGSAGQQALDDLEGRFPELAGAAAQVVVVTPQGQKITDAPARAQVEALVERLKDIDEVTEVGDPFDKNVEGALSEDGRAALVTAQLDVGRTDVDPATLTDIEEAAATTRAAGYTVETGGGAYMAPTPKLSLLEAVGLVIALLVLLATFRSLLAAAMPLTSALVGAAGTGALVWLLTAAIDVPGTAPLLALMIGIAVGIDYSLFLLSRHREQLAEGMELEESAALATATAGGAVVFAGITVIIALLGLLIAGLPFLSIMGIAAAGGVAVAVTASITFLPALMGVAGERLLPSSARAYAATARRERAEGEAAALTQSEQSDEAELSDEAQPSAADQAVPAQRAEVGTAAARTITAPAVPAADNGTADEVSAQATATAAQDGPPRDSRRAQLAQRKDKRGWARSWVRAAIRIPALTCLLVTGALVALAAPATDLRLALPDNGTMATSQSARRTYDLVSQHFGPGANGPLIVTVDVVASNDPVKLIDDIEAEVAATPGVERISLATPNRKVDTGVIIVVPEGGPTDDSTRQLVRDLRDLAPVLENKYDTNVAVTGQTAIEIDVSERLSKVLLPFAMVVMGLSLVLLMTVFRSFIVPLTATLGFLLSTAAAFGVVVGVFQYGWLADTLGVTRVGPVISFMPIILMGVLFGLAMDYQVFLVSRMREEYVRGGDPRAAVERGFVSSGPVVAAAAAIMVAVFAAFVPHGDANLKPIALGLTVGVFLDAFIVRMIFVPAALTLFGHATWAFPRALDRLLPHLDVEGEVIHNHLQRSREVREHPERVIETRELSVSGPQGVVFSDLNLHVDQGTLCVLHGPDGSGKTAAVLTLGGRMRFDSGDVEIAGLVLPEQSGGVQRKVALAELPGVNDLDEALSVRDHIAERLATRTLLPWARRQDVQGVLAHIAGALEAAQQASPDEVPRTNLDPETRVGDLSGIERSIVGIALALVGSPPIVAIDETGDLRSRAARRAVIVAVGWFIRTAPQPLTVIATSTESVARDRLAQVAGLANEQVCIVALQPTTAKVGL
ncbi:MMPL family transporter [Gephyromycinifex aptenodytis]|uniref:MMPL family transporter n=1 Tax=Gephyromycinifex aptenodytis TaxID=2716227 RepID=UPI0014485AB8|nr:MMPL family transporter [Gephyromycinifex aptenodytis]